MKSKLFLAAALILLLGGFIGYKMWNKPHMDISAAESFISLSAVDLVQAFKEDETSANTRFLNKVITVSGKIAAVNKEHNQTILHLETEDPMALVICNLDPFSTHEKTDFVSGETVQVKGVCSGMLTDVVIDRCVIIK
ncbi:MAG: hypothetical protein SH818_10210 [Saprospiraceae bacterium]|nr:hypothetical protein [Saprospiraceae bacterium]